MRHIGEKDVYDTLGYAECMEAVRHAMIELSLGRTRQMPRQILPLDRGGFGVMAGTYGGSFGSKLLCVRPNDQGDRQSTHRGVVVLFDAESGHVKATVDAGAVTAVRTAAMTAVATDALARRDARTMAIVGSGEQALHHALALCLVRDFDEIRIWGRTEVAAKGLAAKVSGETGIKVVACATVADATAGTDIITTLTAARDPILFLEHVAPGTHVNAVGSSHDGASEIDEDLVTASAYFGDSRASIDVAGAEFIRARTAGRISDEHFLAEIGEVLSGAHPGRTMPEQRTMFKSLGHIAQDIAAAEFVAGHG